jgi:hypothetical protein
MIDCSLAALQANLLFTPVTPVNACYVQLAALQADLLFTPVNSLCALLIVVKTSSRP